MIGVRIEGGKTDLIVAVRGEVSDAGIAAGVAGLPRWGASPEPGTLLVAPRIPGKLLARLLLELPPARAAHQGLFQVRYQEYADGYKCCDPD